MSSPQVIFLLLSIMGIIGFISGSMLQAPYIGGLICLVFTFFISAVHLIKHLYKNGAIDEIIRNLIKAIPIFLLCLIPIIGQIILILYTLYNVIKIIDNIKELIPALCIYLLLTVLLMGLSSGELNGVVVSGCLYFIVSALYARTFRGMTNQQALVKFSLMWVSYILLSLLVMSIISAVRNAVQIGIRSVTSSIPTIQNVAGYTRYNGTVVSGYQRIITKNVTQQVVTILPSNSSALISKGASEAAASISSKTHKKIKIKNPNSIKKPNKKLILKKKTNTSIGNNKLKAMESPIVNLAPKIESPLEQQADNFSSKLKAGLLEKKIDAYIQDFDLKYLIETKTVILFGTSSHPNVVDKLIAVLMNIDSIKNVENRIIEVQN